jgi:H+-transporting ATPase
MNAQEPADVKTGQPEASNFNTNVDLKSLLLVEMEKQLGSSAVGLSQAEADKRFTQYGPNEMQRRRPIHS